jgi:hypothetical protein
LEQTGVQVSITTRKSETSERLNGLAGGGSREHQEEKQEKGTAAK